MAKQVFKLHEPDRGNGLGSFKYYSFNVDVENDEVFYFDFSNWHKVSVKEGRKVYKELVNKGWSKECTPSKYTHNLIDMM